MGLKEREIKTDQGIHSQRDRKTERDRFREWEGVGRTESEREENIRPTSKTNPLV